MRGNFASLVEIFCATHGEGGGWHLHQISFVPDKQVAFFFQLCLRLHFLRHNECQGFQKIQLQRILKRKLKKKLFPDILWHCQCDPRKVIIVWSNTRMKEASNNRLLTVYAEQSHHKIIGSDANNLQISASISSSKTELICQNYKIVYCVLLWEEKTVRKFLFCGNLPKTIHECVMWIRLQATDHWLCGTKPS